MSVTVIIMIRVFDALDLMLTALYLPGIELLFFILFLYKFI